MRFQTVFFGFLLIFLISNSGPVQAQGVRGPNDMVCYTFHESENILWASQEVKQTQQIPVTRTETQSRTVTKYRPVTMYKEEARSKTVTREKEVPKTRVVKKTR